MPTKKEDLRSSRGQQRKPRKQTKPKYVFKVVKPTATPYKQSQEPRIKLSSEDVLRNLLKQQQQQNALQQQQLFSGFVSQLGTLARQQPVTSGFSTRDNTTMLYPMAQAEYIKPYKPDVRVMEAFAENEPQKKEDMLSRDDIPPPSWAIPKKEEDVWREVETLAEPWYSGKTGISPFEQPPRERTYEKEQKLYPIFEKQKRPGQGIRIEDLHKYPNLPKRTTIQVEKEKAKDDGMTAKERERERLIERDGPYTVDEAKIVFETDFKDKEGKKFLKILTENGMII